jgi:hypothetical protein
MSTYLRWYFLVLSPDLQFVINCPQANIWKSGIVRKKIKDKKHPFYTKRFDTLEVEGTFSALYFIIYLISGQGNSRGVKRSRGESMGVKMSQEEARGVKSSQEDSRGDKRS